MVEQNASNFRCEFFLIRILIDSASRTTLTRVWSQSEFRHSPVLARVAFSAVRCHSLSLFIAPPCRTPTSRSWYTSVSLTSLPPSEMRALVMCVQAFLVAVQCLHKSVLGAARRRRDLIYENMVTSDRWDLEYYYWGILVRLVMCVMVGHQKLKIEIIKLLTILC